MAEQDAEYSSDGPVFCSEDPFGYCLEYRLAEQFLYFLDLNCEGSCCNDNAMMMRPWQGFFKVQEIPGPLSACNGSVVQVSQ